MSKTVSITLQNNEDARPIIRAIQADNPASQVNEMPAMVKIDSQERIRINRSTVEELLGREWDVQELHLSIVSLAGHVEEEDDFFELFWN